jgi:hypothetical protein
VFFFVPVVAIASWAAIVLYRMHLIGQSREQAHRERLAMIEKGLALPPLDPLESSTLDPMSDWRPVRSVTDRRVGARNTGIILIGTGVGVAAMFYLIGQAGMMGIGALLVALGLAFLLVSGLDSSRPPADRP